MHLFDVIIKDKNGNGISGKTVTLTADNAGLSTVTARVDGITIVSVGMSFVTASRASEIASNVIETLTGGKSVNGSDKQAVELIVTNEDIR